MNRACEICCVSIIPCIFLNFRANGKYKSTLLTRQGGQVRANICALTLVILLENYYNNVIFNHQTLQSWLPNPKKYIITHNTWFLLRYTCTEKNGGSAWISRGSDGPNMMIDYRTAFFLFSRINRTLFSISKPMSSCYYYKLAY